MYVDICVSYYIAHVHLDLMHTLFSVIIDSQSDF